MAIFLFHRQKKGTTYMKHTEEEKSGCANKPARVYTKLKFYRNPLGNSLAGYVHSDKKADRVIGVRLDSPVEKMIVLPSKELAPFLKEGTLYDVTLKPMKSSRSGYVAIHAKQCLFRATIETFYVRRIVYRVVVSFGNRKVVFDPKDGVKSSVRVLSECLNVLNNARDIENLELVVADFKDRAEQLLRKYEQDGFYVKWEK